MNKPQLFKKGHTPWNKGKKLPYAVASAWKKGNIPWNKGIPISEELREKLKKIFKGRTTNTGRTHFKKGVATNVKPHREIICLCGKVFSVPPNRIHAKYCSYKCKGQARRGISPANKNGINKVCICGKTFYVPGCRSSAEFCSVQCSGKAKKGIRPKGLDKLLKWQQTSEGKAFCRNVNKGRPSPKRGIPTGYVPKSAFKKGVYTEAMRKGSLLGAKILSERKSTSIEKKVYEELEKRGLLFETQKLINGKFLVDAYIPSLNLVIEADGDYWHSLPKTIGRDKAKNAYLTKCGFNLLRLSEYEINNGSFKERLVF